MFMKMQVKNIEKANNNCNINSQLNLQNELKYGADSLIQLISHQEETYSY
jgi:hypothetical protein